MSRSSSLIACLIVSAWRVWLASKRVLPGRLPVHHVKMHLYCLGIQL